MISYLLLFFLVACGFKKNPIAMTKSPCFDGLHAIMNDNNCVSFDWGVNPTGEILKIRCTWYFKNFRHGENLKLNKNAENEKYS